MWSCYKTILQPKTFFFAYKYIILFFCKEKNIDNLKSLNITFQNYKKIWNIFSPVFPNLWRIT